MSSDQFTRRDVNHALLVAAWALVARGAILAEQGSKHLFDFAIAGGWYHGLKDVGDEILAGERLKLQIEPDNPRDSYAVAVHRADGLMLGYIPRAANQPIFLLLASDTRIDAQVVSRLIFNRAAEITDDFVFTGFTCGDPRVRLTLRG